MARRKNTLMDNEYADQFFGKQKGKTLMGDGFIGMHQQAKKMKAPKKLFPSVEDFMR